MEGLNPADIILHIINVAVFMLLLRLILWRKIEQFMRARQERVAGELEQAAEKNRAADALRLEYERNIEQLEVKGHEILRESQEHAAQQSEAVLNAAREQAEVILRDARERAGEERRHAVEMAQHDISDLASELASRILHREVSPEDDIAAVMDFFKRDSF